MPPARPFFAATARRPALLEDFNMFRLIEFYLQMVRA
jgi:hypothetical protein